LNPALRLPGFRSQIHSFTRERLQIVEQAHLEICHFFNALNEHDKHYNFIVRNMNIILVLSSHKPLCAKHTEPDIEGLPNRAGRPQ
jgi:hypothetical protein